MNCLEFRRRVETAPGELGAGALAHTSACAACAQFHRRALQFDASLRDATRVSPPENMEARILMRQSFDQAQPARAWKRAWPTLAAGLVLALAVALYAGRIVQQEAGLHAELVALVNAADYALHARGPVAQDAVGNALRPVGLDLREALGNVSFAGRCLVRGNLSGHLVLRDSTTPVTVFLMPEEHVNRTSRFQRERWHGVLVPADRGTLGIVAPRGEPLDPRMVERLVRAVRWPA